MEWLLIGAVVVAGIVVLFRHLRRREIEAFLDADMSHFRDFAEVRPESALTPDQETRANVVQLQSAAAAPRAYAARQVVLDEPHRLFQVALEECLGDRLRLLPRVPLADVIHADDAGAQYRLRSRTLSFVVCTSDFRLVCGIHLAGASASEKQDEAFLNDVFHQAGKTLLSFPLMAPPATSELIEALTPVLRGSPLTRHCPRCGKELSMRKAVKGRNAGKSFWVCKKFPSCRGITRIGQS